MPLSEIFTRGDIFTPERLAEARSYQERREYVPPQDLVASYDSLFQSQDYLLALGKAANLPRGVYARRELDDRRRVKFEKNGAEWTFEMGTVTRTVTQQRSAADLNGQMSFDVPVVDIEVSETISVDPENVTWKRDFFPMYRDETLPDDLKRGYDCNSVETENRARAILESYHNPPPQVEQPPAPEAIVFVSDPGKVNSKGEFKSITQRVKEALQVMKSRRGIFSVSVQRNSKGDIRLFVVTRNMYVKDEEKAAMVEGIEGVDVIFDPLRDEVWEWADPKIKEELAKWSHVGTVNILS